MSRQAWMKFYPGDWRADPRLRICSLAARGLWIDLISYMHEGEPYGHLTIDGRAPDIHDTAALVGRPVAEVRKALAELHDRQVFSTSETGAVFSRRMVRDKAKADRDRANGKEGGNPKLIQNDNGGVNPPNKAQKLEARNQKLDPSLRSGRRAGARTRLADDWGLDERDLDYARNRGFTDAQIESIGVAFANYHKGKGNLMADWHAAWRTWCDNEVKFAKGGPYGGTRAGKSARSGTVAQDTLLAGMASALSERPDSRLSSCGGWEENDRDDDRGKPVALGTRTAGNCRADR